MFSERAFHGNDARLPHCTDDPRANDAHEIAGDSPELPSLETVSLLELAGIRVTDVTLMP